MIFYPLFFKEKLNVVLIVFGALAVFFGCSDLLLYNKQDELKENWLKQHLGKMTGGYIAAVSAFCVVNEILPGVWNWFTPGIIGGVYIAYWNRKIEKT